MATITITISDVSSIYVNEDEDGQSWAPDSTQLSAAAGIIESAIENALQVEQLEGTVEISWEN